MKKGIIVAVLHCALVLSLAAKYAYDRERFPRVWVKCAPVDPNLPVRGRYISLRLEVDTAGAHDSTYWQLHIQDGRLVATPSPDGVLVSRFENRPSFISEPVPYFIPEHAEDPSQRRDANQELWVEATVPPEGLPRPLRLGLKKAGTITPLPQ